jgi:phage major head subunit gpT-like protein
MSDTNENAIVAERTRAAEIVSLTRKLDLGDAFSDAQIASGASLDSVRAAALDAVAAKSAAVATSSVRASVSDESIENPAVKRTALEGALSARIAGVSPTGVAAQFAGVGVVGIARELTGLHRASNDQVIERAMAVSSDFPIVLANVANKVLLDTYKVAEPTFVKWSKKVDFNDFRAHSFASLGDFPALAAKAEGADYTESTIGEKGESITATELGRIFHLSRRAMVNDDLGAFSNIATLAATRARLTENSKVYGVLSTNAVLSDSVALFHATHGNLAGTGAAPSVATIAAGRLAMLSQTSVDGLPLNIGPTYLVCGPTTELAALKAVGVIAPAVETNVNPFAGKIEVVVDATITGNEWYLVASPVLAPSVGYGYVAGRGPFLTSRVKFESQSFQFLLGLDFGTGALDYRGIYKNSGAS